MLINVQMYFHFQEISPSYDRCNYSILLAVPRVLLNIGPKSSHLTSERYTDQATQDHGMTWETRILKYSYPGVLRYSYQSHGWTSMRSHNNTKLQLYSYT